MKRIWKLSLLVASAGVVLQLGNCGRFWGDLVGDAIWLRAVD